MKHTLVFLTFAALTVQAGTGADTSVSSTQDARAVFTNPAGLAFQSELNGTSLMAMTMLGVNQNAPEDISASLSYANIGFGIERLYESPPDSMTRYTAGLGVAVTPTFFTGLRYRYSQIHSIDFGFQYRPVPYFALGVMANQLNQPTLLSGETSPIQFVFGATVRPIPRLSLRMDTETFSGPTFGKNMGVQGSVEIEAIRGLCLSAGYHQTRLWNVGLRLQLGTTSLAMTTSPASEKNLFTSEISFSSTPSPSIFEPATLILTVDNTLRHEPPRRGLFITPHPSLIGLLRTLESASQDPSIHSIKIRLEQFPLGLASAQEVFEAIWRLRVEGKDTEVFLENASLKEFLIASAAQRISVSPSGELRLLGLKAERYFLKGPLDKLGVEGEFLARGEFKSAPEQFTRRESSDINRKALTEEIATAEATVVALLNQTRKIDTAKWRTLQKTGLFSAEEALANGLVDRIADWDTHKKSWPPTKSQIVKRTDALSLPPRIAIIVADGDILNEKVRLLTLAGHPQITPEKIEKRLDFALNDSRTKAIILRVNSGGGEILASHRIATLIEQSKKPIYVSMADVAASGGYLISAPAKRIFAMPLTTTGSIGVFLGKFNLQKLYKTFDLHKEFVGSSPYPGLFSESRAWSDKEREVMLRRLNSYYESFVKYVSTRRKVAPALIEEAAKGRVWGGQKAIEKSLVDERGGLLDAVHSAELSLGFRYHSLEIYPISESSGLFQLFDEESLFAQSQPVSEWLGRIAPELRWASSLSENPFLYLSETRMTDQ